MLFGHLCELHLTKTIEKDEISLKAETSLCGMLKNMARMFFLVKISIGKTEDA